MGIAPGTKLTDITVDRVFIGSCTNARIEDLRAAAAVLAGRASKVPGLVSPGSSRVKRQAEEEGLDRIFRDAGLEWADFRLLDVRRHQWRSGGGRRTLRLDHQPQFPRPSGARRAHASDVAGHGGRGSRQRTSRRRAAVARRAQALEGRMEKFVRLTAKACPLIAPNLNTDQILPARYLKWPRARGLGTVLFQDLRFDRRRRRAPGFSAQQTDLARRQNSHRRTQFRRRFFARGGGVRALRFRHSLRYRAVLRRHLRSRTP